MIMWLIVNSWRITFCIALTETFFDICFQNSDQRKEILNIILEKEKVNPYKFIINTNKVILFFV